MKQLIIFIFTLSFPLNLLANEPDSVYLFSYATAKNGNTNGLHFAWSINRLDWYAIGPEYGFLHSDYGRWGTEKKMIDPFLFRGADQQWHCIWSLNGRDGVFAHAASPDLIVWGRQSYPQVIAGNNCLHPVITKMKDQEQFKVQWQSNLSGLTKAYEVSTKNFKEFTLSSEVQMSEMPDPRSTVLVSGHEETGMIYKVAWSLVDGLVKQCRQEAYSRAIYGETTQQDGERFGKLDRVEATITVDPAKSKTISDLLIGVFFEDINYAADGGLYAELIQNRDFEYDLSDKEGNDKSWNHTKAWQMVGVKGGMTVDTLNPIHPNNKHYLLLDSQEPGIGVSNEGFDGIALKAGEKYDLSLFACLKGNSPEGLKVRLTDKEHGILAEGTIPGLTAKWKKYGLVLSVSTTVSDARLEILPTRAGKIGLDMVSLFPEKTFKNRKNGLRADLAQTIADIKPRFVRFPGGCVAHGDGLGNIYRWKNTIGPLEARKPQRNLWGYHQTAGLGYFEYFQFCEDIGAQPLPVIAAGVPCQNSGVGGAGQQGGIPLCEMDSYIQDILDLVEYANGDIHTKWGKIRAEAGHPQPFNLRFIGIGNEDLITDIFEERFTKIFRVMQEKHPEITVIGTVGPWFEGTDYNEGWELATRLKIPMVDEHYYQSPGWFIHNQDFYDRYDRSKSKVYLGEYAAHLPGRPNNVETALAEAIYLTAVERNGDVVSMTSYAPMLAKEKHTQWNPDMIYFNNTEVKPTVGYYVQQMFGNNMGNEYIPCFTSLNVNQDNVSLRVGVSLVKDSKQGDYILKMVNILPKSVSVTVDLSALSMDGKALKTVLTGKPGEQDVKPVKSDVEVGSTLHADLPAYSFTIYRFKAK